jgi:hypothetical protein
MTSGRLLLCVAALCAVLAEVRATPLDADACAKLAIEHGELEVAGIDKEMAKGPEWGRANLGPEKLAQVRRFIELEELMLFRCRGKSLVTLPPDPEPSPTGDQDKQHKQDADDKQDKQGKEPPASKSAKPAPAAAPAKGQAAAAKQKTEAGKKANKFEAGKPKPAIQPKPASQPTKQEPAKKAQSQTAAPRPPVSEIAKSPPKAKVDDAYKAPPPDPSVNPFADQLKQPAR